MVEFNSFIADFGTLIFGILAVIVVVALAKAFVEFAKGFKKWYSTHYKR